MKFKFYYVIILYEVITFIHEMYKRNAKSIRFELQESVGKVNIYIDDSSFKQIDGSIAWKIVKSMFSYFSKKENKDDKFDKDKNINGTLNQDDFDQLNKKFKFNIIPLPKGKSISYSYIKKSGNIYEAAFTLVSNDLDSYILDKVKEFQDLINSDIEVFFDDENHGIIEIESLSFKKEKIKMLCENKDGENFLQAIDVKEALKNKKSVNIFFNRFSTKSNVPLKTDEVVKSNKTDNEDIEKISW